MSYDSNICLITIDSLRSDCSYRLLKGLKYGKKIFPNTYPRNIPTIYSFTPILNGVPVLTFANYVGIQSNVPTLAEVLKKLEYKTLAFVDEIPYLHPKIYGYGKGFDQYSYEIETASKKVEENKNAKTRISKIKSILPEKIRSRTHALRENFRNIFPSLRYREELFRSCFLSRGKPFLSYATPNTGQILSKAFTRIKELDRKFFLFIHLLDVHSPYKFPPTFLEKIYGRDKVKKYLIMKRFANRQFLIYAQRYTFHNRKKLPDDISRTNKVWYNVSIKYVSELLNDFIRNVYEKFPNTLFVITSDHGEGFGEHGFYGHHGGVFHHQEVIRVPLILIHPSFNKTSKIETNISSLDVPPTILEFADTKPPKYYLGKSVFDRKKDDIIICESFPRPPILWGTLPRRIKIFTAVRTVIMNNYKLTVNQQFKQKRLINLSEDPLEIENEYNRYQLLAKRLETVIRKLEEHEQNIALQ